jgi:hypothetical protein
VIREALSDAQEADTFLSMIGWSTQMNAGQENAAQNWPNKSLQPTATAVTPPAAQEIVPAVAVAEH